MDIGGFLGLDLVKGKNDIHKSALKLKSARASFNFILRIVNPKLIYLPFYTCDALIQPLSNNGIPFKFLRINENFEYVNLPKLGKEEFILFINYWGIKDKYVQKLFSIYQEKLILDNSHAYFYRNGNVSWSFNSARKFFGVPDGSMMYLPVELKGDCETTLNKTGRNKKYELQHLIERQEGNTTLAYRYFLKNEKLIDSKCERLSLISELILSHLDYARIANARKENFLFLHTQLKPKNILNLDYLESSCVPIFYPYLSIQNIDKEKLWREGIFIPYLWNDCLDRQATGFSFEKDLSNKILPLPVDHRYNENDLRRVISFLDGIEKS